MRRELNTEIMECDMFYRHLNYSLSKWPTIGPMQPIKNFNQQQIRNLSISLLNYTLPSCN